MTILPHNTPYLIIVSTKDGGSKKIPKIYPRDLWMVSEDELSPESQSFTAKDLMSKRHSLNVLHCCPEHCVRSLCTRDSLKILNLNR